MPQKRGAIECNKQAARVDKTTDNSLAYLQRAAVQIMPDSAERLAGVGRVAQVLPNHQTGHASATNCQHAKQKLKHLVSIILHRYAMQVKSAPQPQPGDATLALYWHEVDNDGDNLDEVVLSGLKDTDAGANKLLAIIDDAEYRLQVENFQHGYAINEIETIEVLKGHPRTISKNNVARIETFGPHYFVYHDVRQLKPGAKPRGLSARQVRASFAKISVAR